MSSTVGSPSPTRVAFGDRTNAPAGAAQAGVAKAVSGDTGSVDKSVAPAAPQGTAKHRIMYPSWGAYAHKDSAAEEVAMSGFLPKGKGSAGYGYAYARFATSDEYETWATGVIGAMAYDGQLVYGGNYAPYQYEMPDGVADVVFDLNPFPHYPSVPDTLRYWDDKSDSPARYGGHTGDYASAFDLPEYPSVPPGAHYRLEMPFYAKWVPYNTDSGHDNEDGAGNYDADGPVDSGAQDGDLVDEHRADDGDSDEDAMSPLPSRGWHLAWDESAYWTWYYLYYGYRASTDDNADSAGEDRASDSGADGVNHSVVHDDTYAEALAYYGYDPAEFYDCAPYDTEEGDTHSSSASDEEEDTEELDNVGSGFASESDEYYIDEESAREDGV